MRNWDQYIGLWQQKRNDLQVDMDPQADWSAMHQLLDVQMPATNAAVGTQSLFKTALLHITKFKLLYALAALLSAGTITYFVLHHHTAVNNKHNHPEINKVSGDHNVNAIEKTINNKTTKPSSANEVNNKATGDDNNTGVHAPEKTANNNTDKTNGKTVNNKLAGNSYATANNNRTRPFNSSSGGASSGNVGVNKVTKAGLNKKGLSSGSTSNLNPRLLGNSNGVLRPSHLSNNRYGNSTAKFNRNNVRWGTSKTRFSGLNTGKPATGLPDESKWLANTPILQAWPPQFIIKPDVNVLAGSNAGPNVTNKTLVNPANTRVFAAVKTKNKATWTLPIDWGILAGINAPGSFTPANKKNTNGLPFDVYAGLFATYNLNNKWAINLQTRIPTPHQVSGSYSHTEEGRADTGKTAQTVNSKITDSRKMYTADIALHLVYNVNSNIGVKVGPVLSIPLKQANGVSSVSTSGTPKDSLAYYSKLTEAINNTNIEKKMRYGISGGVGLNYKRFLLDATYYHGFQTQKVSSSLGGYTSNTNSLQIIIGFRLNKKK